LLNLPARSTADALSLSGERLVCTYEGALPGESARLARVGLMMFNDVILRTAVEWNLGAIELRAVCNEAADYANPIEPSGHGGNKIAMAVVRAVSRRQAASSEFTSR
jgi:hypothetical protein